MPKRIVYTRSDGGVSVCAPSQTAMRYMTGGGGRWDGFPPGFLDRQIAEQSKYGVGEWAAASFVHAMQYGGLTTAEAYAVLRDRFCAHLGTGCELWDVEDLPLDRWFRNAWRRSHNGGPIDINLALAKRIQLRRVASLVPDTTRYRSRIRRARSLEELRAIYPRMKKHGLRID